MTRYLAPLVSFIFFLLLIAFPTKSFAAPSFFTSPSPPIADKPTYLIAKGCAPGTEVAITWTKQGGNTIPKKAPVEFNGIGVYYHAQGYSLEKNTSGTSKYYDAKATCSDGSSQTIRFTPIAQPNNGYSIEKDSSLHGDYICKEYPKFGTFTDATSCNAHLNLLKQTSGNYWQQTILKDDCTSGTINPPSLSKGITYYSSYAACYQSIDTTGTYYLCPGFTSTGGAFCTKDQNASSCGNAGAPLDSYSTVSSCLDAIKKAFVYVINTSGSQRSCLQINKSGSTGGQSFATKEECEAEIETTKKWAQKTPEEVLGGSRPCLVATNGLFTSENACLTSFCDTIESQRGSIHKAAFEAYCEDIASQSLTPAPTQAVIDPPPCGHEIKDNGCGNILTAFGNFKTNPQGFLTRLFSILLSLSGGIALLFIIRSGYQLMTSQGDPEKVKEARERITSAIVGLLFIVFSLVILEVIGVDILAIPGLSR